MSRWMSISTSIWKKIFVGLDNRALCVARRRMLSAWIVALLRKVLVFGSKSREAYPHHQHWLGGMFQSSLNIFTLTHARELVPVAKYRFKSTSVSLGIDSLLTATSKTNCDKRRPVCGSNKNKLA